MRVAICTDIHGNRQAFEAVIAAADADGCEDLWCLGDLVGYGAEPDACVALIGHSHVALSFHRPEGEPASGTTRREGSELDLATGEWLVNPGSTGQPRDGDPRAAWLALDTTAKTAVYRRAEYDIAAAQA